MAKIEPAVTQLLYQVPDGISYIDLAKDLSKVNRRMYRQGYTYVVQDIQIAVSAGAKPSDVQYLGFATAGNSWIVHNAWKKGFEAWRSQTKKITASPDGGPGDHGRHHHGAGIGIQGKWADFKVYLDDAMEDGTILEPYAGDGAVYQAGEWEHSKLVFDDDGTEREFKMHLIGSSNLADTNEESGIGLIQEYADSRSRVRATPSSESEASDTIYAKILGLASDELTDMMVDNLEGDNDSPPYDIDDYPGGAANADVPVPVRIMAMSGALGSATGGGFIAPCGLIQVQTAEFAAVDLNDINTVYADATAPTIAVLLTVAAGPYRGVLAAPMGQ